MCFFGFFMQNTLPSLDRTSKYGALAVLRDLINVTNCKPESLSVLPGCSVSSLFIQAVHHASAAWFVLHSEKPVFPLISFSRSFAQVRSQPVSAPISTQRALRGQRRRQQKIHCENACNNTIEAAGGFSHSLNFKHRNWLLQLFITLSLLLWAKQQANKGPAVCFSIFCWLVWFLGVSYASVSMSCLFFPLWSITIIRLSLLTPSLHQPVPRDVHFVDHVNYYLCLSFFILNAIPVFFVPHSAE